MLPQLPLTAEPRALLGKGPSGRLRRTGVVPAVLYGGKEKTRTLQLVERELVPVLKAASKGNVLVDLTIKEKGGEEKKLALIKARQFHPVDNRVLHVDFLSIRLEDKIEVQVPIVPSGIPAGTKDGGGVLVTSLRELLVRGPVDGIPDRIEFDVSPLKIGASVHVSDLAVPQGISVLSSPGATVFALRAPTELKEPTPEEVAVAAPEATQPEVIGEKERLERQAAKGQAKPAETEAAKKEASAQKAAPKAAPKAEAKKEPKK